MRKLAPVRGEMNLDGLQVLSAVERMVQHALNDLHDQRIAEKLARVAAQDCELAIRLLANAHRAIGREFAGGYGNGPDFSIEYPREDAAVVRWVGQCTPDRWAELTIRGWYGVPTGGSIRWDAGSSVDPRGSKFLAWLLPPAATVEVDE